MQSYYSFYGSRLHLILEDEIAENYNHAVDAFIEAQVNYRQAYGRKWQPPEPLLMRTCDEWQDAYDKVGSIINLLVKVNGGGLEIPEEECTSDHLVKL